MGQILNSYFVLIYTCWITSTFTPASNKLRPKLIANVLLANCTDYPVLVDLHVCTGLEARAGKIILWFSTTKVILWFLAVIIYWYRCYTFSTCYYQLISVIQYNYENLARLGMRRATSPAYDTDSPCPKCSWSQQDSHGADSEKHDEGAGLRDK